MTTLDARIEVARGRELRSRLLLRGLDSWQYESASVTAEAASYLVKYHSDRGGRNLAKD